MLKSAEMLSLQCFSLLDHLLYVGLCQALNSTLHLFLLKCFSFPAAKELSTVMMVSGFCVMSCVMVFSSGLFQCVGRNGEESASFAVPVMTLSILKVRSLSVKPFVKYLSFIMQFLSSEHRFANM